MSACLLALMLLVGNAQVRATSEEDVAEWSRLGAEARSLYESGKAVEAAAASRRTLDFAIAHEATLGVKPLALSWHNFGQTNYAAEKLPEAKEAYDTALPLLEKAYGPESVQVAIALNSLAVVSRDLEKYGDAEKSARRALAIAMAEKPPGERVAEFSNTLAWICFDTQRYAEAAALFEGALKVLVPIAGEKDPRVAMMRKQLEIARSGTPTAGLSGMVATSAVADAHATFIEKVVGLGRERKEAEFLACIEESTLKSSEAAIREFLNTRGYKFFADAVKVSTYEHVSRADGGSGRVGYMHYGFVENKKHKLQPFQLAIVDTSAGPRLLYIDTGSCTAGKHPAVGPCK